ncbi:hypothetical protein L1987_54166 [Smallanthus sonchifolius]|uniref:Uncharacterized protein n=1 Tax=Smallanthus sonchifolius TaxID=185202 RepID=A0ACB9E733_9ASTR|nr:hypothetical protein L1987_54166 [Smallanthus sonchifolius]
MGVCQLHEVSFVVLDEADRMHTSLLLREDDVVSHCWRCFVLNHMCLAGKMMYIPQQFYTPTGLLLSMD